MGRTAAGLLCALLLSPGSVAQDIEPRVPAGRDPGGAAVALLSGGIDYTLPAVAARLARDGEGEIIAWDFERNDNRPFDRSRGASPEAWGGDATAIASGILKEPGVRLVVVRVLPGDPVALARAVVFLSQTPARIVVVPMRSVRKQDWEPFAQAAAHFKDMLFIVAAVEMPEPDYPAALNLENALPVPPALSSAESSGFGGAPRQLSGPHLGLAAAARVAATVFARNPTIGVAELKRLVAEGIR